MVSSVRTDRRRTVGNRVPSVVTVVSVAARAGRWLDTRYTGEWIEQVKASGGVGPRRSAAAGPQESVHVRTMASSRGVQKLFTAFFHLRQLPRHHRPDFSYRASRFRNKLTLPIPVKNI